MATPNGSTQGPIYPLGLLTVAVVGTIIPLNTNVPITDSVGTPAGGVPGNSRVGSPSPLKCNELKIQTPASNTGNVFLIYKGPAGANTAAGTAGCAVILAVPPGQERSIQSQQNANPFTLEQFALDADVAAQKAWVTAIIA